MSTRAVTPAAPAAAFEREPASQFLPDDKHYRLTGELPEEIETAASQRVDENDRVTREPAEKSAETEGASAASDSDTAAASEAATAETEAQKTSGKAKTAATSETRWQKLSRENRELREQNARLQGRAEAERPPVRETKQDSQPAADAAKARLEPKIDDVDAKTNQPKYKTLAEYLADHAKWNREEAVREFQEMSSKTQREQDQAQAEQIIQRTVQERADQARKTYPDYDDAMAEVLAVKDEHGQDAFFFTKGSPIEAFFLDSERGQDVMYAIAKSPDQHKHIFARDAKGNYRLNPVRQLRELAKIELSLPAKGKPAAEAAASSSAKPVTAAPRPPHQVNGNGAVTKDAVERAVEEGDFETYAAAENAKALAKRRGK